MHKLTTLQAYEALGDPHLTNSDYPAMYAPQAHLFGLLIRQQWVHTLPAVQCRRARARTQQLLGANGQELAGDLCVATGDINA